SGYDSRGGTTCGYLRLFDFQRGELAEPGLLYPSSETTERVGRRDGARDSWFGYRVGNWQPDRRAHWHWGWNSPGRIRTRNEVGKRRALYRRCPERDSLDRDGYCHLFAHRHSAASFFGICRRRRVGHHDDSHGHANYRRDAADGAACGA